MEPPSSPPPANPPPGSSQPIESKDSRKAARRPAASDSQLLPDEELLKKGVAGVTKGPKPLKDLARSQLQMPENAKPLAGAGVPTIIIYDEERAAEAKPLMGSNRLMAYSVFPTIAQLFKDVKIDSPQIAIVPYFLDQLGDIRIALNWRLVIKEKFGVEPLFILTNENRLRILDLLKGSEEAQGLQFVDLDTVQPSLCKDLDLILHGPGLHGVESTEPESIISRYPQLEKALGTNRPPLVSILESEPPGFSYSAPTDVVGRAALQLVNWIPDLEGIFTKLLRNPKSLPPDVLSGLPWFIPVAIGTAKSLQNIDRKFSDSLYKLAETVQFILQNHDSLDAEKVKALKLHEVFNPVAELTAEKMEELQYKLDSAVSNIQGIITSEVSKTIEQVPPTPYKDVSLIRNVSRLYELALGLNPIFSLGWFKLSSDLGKWQEMGLIDTPNGRQEIFSQMTSSKNLSKQENSLLSYLPGGSSYVFGYSHNENYIALLVELQRRQNPLGHAVVNLPLNIAVRLFPDCRIMDHVSHQKFEPRNVGREIFTVHLYERLSNPVFDGLMAASDPSIRLAGGDNSFFTSLLLGTDALIYEIRSFKFGMVNALFQLAKALPHQEQNALVDFIIAQTPEDIRFNFEQLMPIEYEGFLERLRSGQAVKYGNPILADAFRHIGDIIRKRASDFNDNMAGFLKLQILTKRNPPLVAEADRMVGNGKDLGTPGVFESIKTRLEELT